MKITQILCLAWKTMNWSKRWGIWILIIFGSVSIFTGGKLYLEVRNEQKQPCELTVTISGGSIGTSIHGDTLQKITQNENVQAVSLVWSLSTSLNYNEYETDLFLYGVDKGYLSGEMIQGDMFPDNSAMPYLVLNLAAIQSLRNEKNALLENPASVDWSTKQLLLGGKTDVRICGIIGDGREEPRAYLSQGQAKQLRSDAGQESPADTLWLRLVNDGVRSQVEKDMMSLGLQAEVGNDQNTDWEIRTERGGLYMTVGVIGFICAAMLNRFTEQLYRKEEQFAINNLIQMGIPGSRIRFITGMRWIIIYAAGIMAGLLIIYFL